MGDAVVTIFRAQGAIKDGHNSNWPRKRSSCKLAKIIPGISYKAVETSQK